MVAKHTPEQLPTGIFGNRADKLYPTLEVLMLGFIVSHMLRSGLEIAIFRLSMRASSHTLMILALIFSASPDAARFAASTDSATKARGSSPLYSSGIPTTQASATSGCRRRCPSNSAGATWNARTFRISYEDVVIMIS